MNDSAIFIFLLKCFEHFWSVSTTSHHAKFNFKSWLIIKQIDFSFMFGNGKESKNQNNFRTWFIYGKFLVRFIATRQIWIKSKITQRKFINGANSSLFFFLNIQYVIKKSLQSSQSWPAPHRPYTAIFHWLSLYKMKWFELSYELIMTLRDDRTICIFFTTDADGSARIYLKKYHDLRKRNGKCILLLVRQTRQTKESEKDRKK